MLLPSLDSRLRKLKALREEPVAPLAGRMGVLLDLGARLPLHIWYEPDPHASDYRFLERLLLSLRADDLVVFDMGLLDFAFFRSPDTAAGGLHPLPPSQHALSGGGSAAALGSRAGLDRAFGQ